MLRQHGREGPGEGRSGMGKETAGVTRSATRVGAATMLSRVFGLARDTFFAVLFGTGFVADAFNLAFLIPNFFRRVVGEGNLNPAFVPVFTELHEKNGTDVTRVFLRRTSGSLLVVLLVFVLLGVVFAGPLVRLYASGWSDDPAEFSFARLLLQILFPSLLFAGMSALATATLNAQRKFVVPALAPIVLNVGFLLGAVAALAFETLEARAIVFSIGGLVGGLAAWLVQTPSLREIGYSMRPLWAPNDPQVRRVAALMGPGILALGVTQLNLFVDTLLALRLDEGSLSALRLGNRLVLLPMGVIGVAVATASLPTLARHAAADNRAALLGMLAHTLKLLLTLLVPAAVGLLLLSAPIVTLLFQYGEFSAERSTPMTAAALRYYALGLPAFGLVRGLAQGFYSVQDTKTPVKIATVGMIVNISLSFALMGPLGLRGLALATAAAAWVNVSLSLVLLSRRLGTLRGTGLTATFGRVVLATALLAAGVLAGDALTAGVTGWLGRGLAVAVPIALGFVGLGIGYAITRHAEMAEILASLPGRRRK